MIKNLTLGAEALFFATALSGMPLLGSETVYSIPDIVDFAHDYQTDTLYITANDTVLRFDTQNRTFLPSLLMDGRVGGIDISLDGATLAIASEDYDESRNWIYLVDTETLEDRKLYSDRASSEAGTFSVAWMLDGSVAHTSRFSGSGWVSLRVKDPQTNELLYSKRVRQNSMLATSTDGLTLAWEESNSSGGPIGFWDVLTGDVVGARVDSFLYEISVNQDGSKFSVPAYDGLRIYDRALNEASLLPLSGYYSAALSATFHPVEDIVYTPLSQQSEIRAYDTNSMELVNTLFVSSDFGWIGNHAYREGRVKLSDDGSLLFATVSDGFVMLEQYEGLAAWGETLHLDEDAQLVLDLPASIGNGGEIDYSITKEPSHGSLVSVDGRYLYVPDDDFFGSDSLEFAAQYGNAMRLGNIELSVSAVNDAPVAVDDFATVARGRSIAIDVLGNDIDVDGDSLVIQSVSRPSRGSVAIVDGQIVYESRRGKPGSVNFGYVVSDGSGETVEASVHVNISKR